MTLVRRDSAKMLFQYAPAKRFWKTRRWGKNAVAGPAVEGAPKALSLKG